MWHRLTLKVRNTGICLKFTHWPALPVTQSPIATLLSWLSDCLTVWLSEMPPPPPVHKYRPLSDQLYLPLWLLKPIPVVGTLLRLRPLPLIVLSCLCLVNRLSLLGGSWWNACSIFPSFLVRLLHLISGMLLASITIPDMYNVHGMLLTIPDLFGMLLTIPDLFGMLLNKPDIYLGSYP